MSKLNNEFVFLDDFWESSGIDTNDMYEFVFHRNDFDLKPKEYKIISEGFRIEWNLNSEETIGDGDLKNATYRHIEREIEKENTKFIDQEKVDFCVELILNYMISIGQWPKDYSKS